jgi:hypothetical protein
MMALGGVGTSMLGQHLQNQKIKKNNARSAMADEIANQRQHEYDLAMQKRWQEFQQQLQEHQRQQIARDTEEAHARSGVIDAGIARQGYFTDQNQATLNDLNNAFSTDAQQAAQQGNEAQRAAGIDAVMRGPVDQAANLPEGISPAVAAEYRKRAAAAAGEAKSEAKLKGNVSAYGDTWAGNERTIGDAQSKIGMNNNFSRAEGGLMQGLSELAGFKARKPIAQPFAGMEPNLPRPVYRPGQSSSGLGSLLQGLGNLGAAYGGQKLGTAMKGSNMFSPAAAAGGGTPWGGGNAPNYFGSGSYFNNLSFGGPR